MAKQDLALQAELARRHGRIVGLVDWANALIADPALEIARVAESGLRDREFAAGYGINPLAGRPLPVAQIYRLYTATMLAVVFLSEAPDRDKANRALGRVQALCEALEL
jgi:hypothetical protein